MLKAAILGCGGVGIRGYSQAFCYSHLGAYQSMPERVEVVAFCDTDFRKAKEAAESYGKSVQSYGHYESMLLKEAPDILSVATPPEVRHEILTSPLIRKLKGIWLEKPVALTIWEADEIDRKLRGMPVEVNYIRRFDAVHREIQASIQAGELEEIREVTARYSGGMARNGSHFVDLFRFWNVLPKAKFVETDGLEGRVTEVELLWKKGRIRLLEGGFTVEVEGPAPCSWDERQITWRKYTRTFQKLDSQSLQTEESWPRPRFMEAALENLLDAILEKKPLLSPLPEATETLRASYILSLNLGLRW